MVAVLGLIVPQVADSQSCGLCRKHANGKCNIPTIENDCGCCNGGET